MSQQHCADASAFERAQATEGFLPTLPDRALASWHMLPVSGDSVGDFQLLQELGTDTCVVVSTHLVEDVAAACTDVVLFAEGRLVFQGTPDELAAAGGPEDVGDSPLERGYAALLQGSAGERGAW